MVHRVAHRAEVRVKRELIADYKRVFGKNGLLFQIAEASLDHPDEPVKEVVYPIADESKLRDLIREFKATGPAYRQQLHTVMRSAHRSHYRAMLIRLLNTLEFRFNNETHRPVLDALAIVKKHAGSRVRVYPVGCDGVLMPRVYMSFEWMAGWRVSFHEGTTVLPRTLFFESEEKLKQLAQRGGGLKCLPDKQALEHAITAGSGGLYLDLSHTQLGTLQRTSGARCQPSAVGAKRPD